ncbi:MAG: M20/M25/M40 family metallo-hydrolase, partial [Defluviitaleaceae bacterium]|nr:M20/M25/M40 family metallo-hydrolase [Defluviitaleaceae bacterium]
VQAIKDNGTMTFIPLGTWQAQVLMGQKVLIKNRKGEIVHGIIASTPPHFVGGFDGAKEHMMSIPQMTIDIGATSKAEAIEVFGMGVACPIVPYSNFHYDAAKDIIMSKALDCRLGCASVIEIMHQVKDLNLDVNVVGTFSAQEENGIRGINIIANRVKPDLAICFEGTPADDTSVPAEMSQTKLKHGPMMRHIDQGMITHPRFMRFALETGARAGINIQEAVRTGGSTNGRILHLSNMGVPTIVIGHPSRYIHSPNSIASLTDYQNGTKLAVEILKALNKDVLAGF